MSSCAKCDKAFIRAASDCLKCENCKRLYHSSCEGMSTQDLQAYKALSPVQKSSWRCVSCTARRKSFMRECETVDIDMHQRKSETEKENVQRNPENRRDTHESEFAELKAIIRTGFERFSARFDEMEKCMKNLEVAFKDANQRIDDLCMENFSLNNRVRLLEDRLESDDRCDTKAIEIHGLNVKDDEDKYDVVRDFLNTCVNCSVEVCDFDECTKIKKRENGNPSKTIQPSGSHSSAPQRDEKTFLIVRFTSRRVREMVLNRWRENCRAGHTKFDYRGSTGLHIKVTERVSVTVRSLFNAVRAAANEKKWKYVWMRNGKVFLRKTVNGEKVLINSLQTLRQEEN